MDKITWIHPTGKAPKTVNLICLGPSKSAYIGMMMQDDLANYPADEVWTLNRGIPLFTHDLGFVMDHIQGEADANPAYGAALWKSDKPIITSDNCDGWPAHVVQYPFREIWNWIQAELYAMHGDWWHNSVAYIVAYAAFIGVRELRIFGADYHNHSSGGVEDGHPCVAYWVGVMERAGLLVRPVESSSFLGTDRRSWIYGYHKDPRAAPKRARFRDLVGLSQTAEGTALDSGERQVAETIDGVQYDHVARYRFAASRAAGDVVDIGGGIGYGAMILAEEYGVDQVTLIDCSQDALTHSEKYFTHEKIRRVQMDLEAPQEIGGNVSVCFEVIEHLVNPARLLRAVKSRYLICSVPNEQVIPYNPETAPFHHRHYTRDQFVRLLSDTGWGVERTYGQDGPTSDVKEFDPAKSRTIIAACHRVTT